MEFCTAIITLLSIQLAFSALIALQVKGRPGATVPETTAEGMCRFAVNLANDIYIEDCKGVVTREGTPQRYLAARLYYSGYDVRIEKPLHELCHVGEASFTTSNRVYDILFGKGAVKVSMQVHHSVEHCSCHIMLVDLVMQQLSHGQWRNTTHAICLSTCYHTCVVCLMKVWMLTVASCSYAAYNAEQLCMNSIDIAQGKFASHLHVPLTGVHQDQKR